VSSLNAACWFEMPVGGMQRATTFSETAIGVKLASNQMERLEMAFFPMEREAAGAAGTLVKGDGYTPSHHGSMVYFRVDASNPTLKAIATSGG
jgi:uncharacterized protein